MSPIEKKYKGITINKHISKRVFCEMKFCVHIKKYKKIINIEGNEINILFLLILFIVTPLNLIIILYNMIIK